MINNITVLENRKLKPTSKKLGVTGENNAEILQFSFPEKIDNHDISELKKTLYFSNTDGTYSLDIVNNTVELSALLTTQTEATMYVVLTAENFLWSSYIYDVTFEQKPDSESGSILDIVRKEVEDELLVKIRDSFKHNVGGNFDYAEMRLNQLIGDRDEEIEGIINPQPYHDGVLYTTARKLQTLVNLFTDEITTGSVSGIYDNTNFLTQETSKIRGYVITAINSTLGTDYPLDTAWIELVEAVQKLPDDVEVKVDGIVSDTITETTDTNSSALVEALSFVNPDVDYSDMDWFELLDAVKALKGDKDKLANLKTELSAKLPLMNFDKMTNEQMIEALVTLITAVVNQPSDTVVVLNECSTELDEDGNVAVYPDTGDMVIVIVSHPLITNEQLGQAVENAENTIKNTVANKVIEVAQNNNLATPDTSTLNNTLQSIDDIITELSKPDDNAISMQSIVDFVEAQTNFSHYIRFFAFGYADHLIKLPYIKTDKMIIDLDNNVHPTYIEELGFDVTSATRFSYGIFVGCVNTKKMILTGMDKRNKETVTNGSLSGLFSNLTGLNDLYVDYICPVNINSKSMNNMFYGLTALETIGGYNKNTRKIDNVNYGKIDFTSCPNTSGMFSQCHHLKDVRFAPNTLTVDLDLSPCASLSKESAISAINACGEVAGKTLKLSVNNPNNQDTDPDIASAIAVATAKGWTVTYA